MMSDKKRNSYSKEFKAHAVSLIIKEGRCRAEVARELGINPNSLYILKQRYLVDKDEAFPGKGNMIAEQTRYKMLEKENKKLKEEVEILTKAAIFFANDT